MYDVRGWSEEEILQHLIQIFNHAHNIRFKDTEEDIMRLRSKHKIYSSNQDRYFDIVIWVICLEIQ